jgi:hypothetical protein
MDYKKGFKFGDSKIHYPPKQKEGGFLETGKESGVIWSLGSKRGLRGVSE